MSGKAFLFLNREQALRFGHVGWGFLLPDNSYFFGSTDHLWQHPWWDLLGWLRYAHVPCQVNNDWWGETGSLSRMLSMMRDGHHIRYHVAKVMTVDNPQPQKAIEKAQSQLSCGWSVLDNNCVHQVHEVLTAYGAVLPDPQLSPVNLVPRAWFARTDGRAVELDSWENSFICSS